MNGELVLTPEGHRELEAELRHLRDVRGPEVAERLRQAVDAAGDLGDNPEYLDAQLEYERLEQRIAVLQERIAAARVLTPEELSTSRISLGTALTLEDIETGDVSRFVLVSSAEGDPAAGRLSNESPVGRALVGHRAGDTVAVQTPRGKRRLRIVAAGPADTAGAATSRPPRAASRP